jgi:hypothetical protein
MNLVGELVINQAMLSQRLTEAGLARSSEIATGLDEFEQLTRNIQEGVMAIRAQPVKLSSSGSAPCRGSRQRPERKCTWLPKARAPKSTKL